MNQFRKMALAMCCVFTAAAAPSGVVQAAPMAGLSLAAASVQALAEPAATDFAPDTVHYRRYHHHHHHYHCLSSFYRCFYGDSPRYFYPSYQYLLDGYTYYYPPFYS